MPPIRTYGRMPTLGEVKEYYSREDVLTFLNYACKKRKVIFSFKDEPSLSSEASTPLLEPGNIEHLHQIITEGIEKNMQGMADDAHPPAYPSFHGMTAKDGDVISDFVMEADCHGWRRSFVDVRGAIELLSEFRVPHIVKFSGHRSLHVMILREAFPEEFDGVPVAQAWKSLAWTLRRFFEEYAQVRYAHDTGGLLRLPYSLNENTGLVSLPIPPEELDDFRPWEAILHLVEEVCPNLFDVSADNRDRTAQFLHAALIEKRITPLKSKIWGIRPKQNLYKYRHLIDELPSINSDDPIERGQAAWKLMVDGERVSDEIFKLMFVAAKQDNKQVIGYVQESSPDVRWFIAEALMGDERATELLYEEDEYAADAIDDSVSLAPIPFLHMLLSETTDWEHSSVAAMHVRAISERVAGTLKDEIIRQAEIIHEDKAFTLVKCAYTLGGTGNDWDTASEVAAILERRFPHKTDIISQDVFINMKRLESDDWEEEHKAKEALIAAGERATDALILAVESVSPWKRPTVISILCEIGDARAIPTLVNALGDFREPSRRMAMDRIRKFGKETEGLKELLVEAAESDNPELRANAMIVLRLLDDTTTEALEAALKSLEDREPGVREAGAKSLGKIGGPRAINGLKRVLSDEDTDVGTTAAFALSDLGSEGETALRTTLKSDNIRMARCAAHALAEMGDASAIDLVIDAFNDDEWECWRTAFSLAKSGDMRAFEALLECIKRFLHAEDMPSKAFCAVRALEHYTDKRATDMLKRVLYTKRERRLRKAATLALRNMGTAEAVDVLLEALISNDSNLRQHAANALMKMGPEILPRLRTLKEQTQGKRRRMVARVLAAVNIRTAFSQAEAGDTRAFEALLESVKNSLYEDLSPEIIRSIKALGYCPDKRAVDMLKTVISTRRDHISWRATTMALRKIGTAEAVDVLLEALVSDYESLRKYAGRALMKMGGEIQPRLSKLADQVTGEKHRAVMSVLQSVSMK